MARNVNLGDRPSPPHTPQNQGGGASGAHDPDDPKGNGNKCFAKEMPLERWEPVDHFFFGDPYAKWGPFRKVARAAKKSHGWQEAKMQDVLAGASVDKTPGEKKKETSRSNGNVNRNGSAASDSPLPPPPPFDLDAELQQDSRPSQIDFAEWFGTTQHPRDYEDDWYKKYYRVFYQRTFEFAEKWFDCNINFAPCLDDQSPWGAPMMEQFIQYSRLVAHEDRPISSWAHILNDPIQRKWLIVGILSQIMEKKVFSELLYGAPKFHKDELERLDMLWLNSEGYTRKEGRITTCRAALDKKLVPDKFWSSVDDLTAKSVAIFRPVFNMMQMFLATMNQVPAWYNQRRFWQELHTLFAYAGYFQVCMAISPSVFHMLSATPGARMDYALEQQADIPLYRASKEAHERNNKLWREVADAKLKGERITKAELLPYEKGFPEWPEDEKELRIAEHHRLRGAKVKFSVFPGLTRYKPENVGKPQAKGPATAQDDVEKSEGQLVSELCNVIVVYYQGLIYPEKDMTDGVPLEIHINTIRRKKSSSYDPWSREKYKVWNWNGDWTYTWRFPWRQTLRQIALWLSTIWVLGLMMTLVLGAAMLLENYGRYYLGEYESFAEVCDRVTWLGIFFLYAFAIVVAPFHFLAVALTFVGALTPVATWPVFYVKHWSERLVMELTNSPFWENISQTFAIMAHP